MDVGGDLGHDLEELKLEHPGVPGRLVLQGQPEVVAQDTKASDGIESTAHDFFTLQPLKSTLQKGYWYACDVD